MGTSYVFQKKANVAGVPASEADYEFRVYGGCDQNRSLNNELRQRLCLNILPALRDAEAELGTWRTSPIRPLLDVAISGIPINDLAVIAAALNSTAESLRTLPSVQSLDNLIAEAIAWYTGPGQNLRTKIAFTASEPQRLFRTVGLYIDDGKRSVVDASSGSANLILLALRLLEFEWRRTRNERTYTVLCIEEPEAHLHPQLQRSVFQKLLSRNGGPTLLPQPTGVATTNQPPLQQVALPQVATMAADTSRSMVITTHSPTIVSVSNLTSIVLLKDSGENGTRGYSLARLQLPPNEMEDLQRYLDASRAELLFARGVLFVEGDAEATLFPAFARNTGFNLDELGVTICNISGIHFRPYLRLALLLSLPFSVVTDWDPLDGTQAPLGRERLIGLASVVYDAHRGTPLSEQEMAALRMDDVQLKTWAKTLGLFTNSNTLEVELANTPGAMDALISTLEAEDFGVVRRNRLAAWKSHAVPIDCDQLLTMVASVGKGRFAARLAAQAPTLSAPTYIEEAIRHVVTRVQQS